MLSLKHYQQIAAMVSGDVSAEVIATDYDGMVKEGHELSGLAENIVVKVPMTREGVRALHHFHDEGIRTNCTLIFNASQALVAAKAGANYVSPFIGRLDDISTGGIDLIKQIVTIFLNFDIQTEVLAASIRSPLHITDCAVVGADVVTCPPKVLWQLLDHPLTDSGLQRFLEDYKAVGE